MGDANIQCQWGMAESIARDGRRLSASTGRALLGSHGVSFRLALAPLTVPRLDVGRGLSNGRFGLYSLSGASRTAGS